MENNKIIELSGKEYLDLSKIVDYFLKRGKKDNPPKFDIICGPIASGKSRFRKNYKNDYVLVDAGEIYLKLTDDGDKKIERILDYMSVVGYELVNSAISERRNILIEIIMDKLEPIKTIIDQMHKIGYENHVEFISNSLDNCLKNNLERSKHNFSAFYSQDTTLGYFLQYFKDEI